MAEVVTTPDKATSAGVKPTTVTLKTTDTHTINNSRALLLRVNNAAAKAATLTFTVAAQPSVHGGFTKTVEAAKETVTVIGPFLPREFGDVLSISTDTEVTVEVVSLPLRNLPRVQ